MIIPNVVPEPYPKTITTTLETDTSDIKRDCEHCGKKSVCKYKERVEKINNDVFRHKVFKFTEKGWDDQGIEDLPILIRIECIEFTMGYTGVR